MSQDPLEQANHFIGMGLPKSPKRVAEIRRKFVRLMFDSHEYGAGGIKDSNRYIAYQRVAQMCATQSVKNKEKASGRNHEG